MGSAECRWPGARESRWLGGMGNADGWEYGGVHMAGEVHMAGRVQVAGKMGNAEYSWLGGMEECRMQAGEKNGGVQMAGESPDDWGMEECTWLEAWGECRWVGAWRSADG